MNLQHIYDQLKKEFESSGIQIDDSKLKQMAWMKRDRLMFEMNYFNTNQSTPSSSVSSGGGGNRNRISDDSINQYVDPDYVDNYFE
jgi:hypothetical protein